jgi:hypothetical protein
MNLDYETFFKELNRIEIDYVVIGGLAVNFHGIPRMTYDIDLVVRLETGNVQKLVARLLDWGFQPRAPVDPEDLADELKRNSWIQDKNMKAFTFFNEDQPISEIDILIDSPIMYEELKKRAIVIEVNQEEIPVASIADLIEMKRQTGRKQDLADVEHLKQIRDL